MADTSSSQLMDQLFSAIYDLVTKEPAPGDQQKLPEGARKGGKFSRSNTAVHIALPGIGLFEDDFRNMWTPGNPTGLKDQTAGFSVLVDSMPAPGSSRYIQSAKRVSQAYQAVLEGANAVPTQMSDATRQMLAKIDKFLWEDKAEPRGPFDDPSAPPPTPQRQKTAVYQKFEKLSEDIGEATGNSPTPTRRSTRSSRTRRRRTASPIARCVRRKISGRPTPPHRSANTSA
jgi:hypothetical protein